MASDVIVPTPALAYAYHTALIYARFINPKAWERASKVVRAALIHAWENNIGMVRIPTDTLVVLVGFAAQLLPPDSHYPRLDGVDSVVLRPIVNSLRMLVTVDGVKVATLLAEQSTVKLKQAKARERAESSSQ